MLELQEKLDSYIENPDLLASDDSETLERLAVKYPYFGTLQALLLKKYQLRKDDRYESQLKRAAFYASSRSRLHELLDQTEGPLYVIKDWSPDLDSDMEIDHSDDVEKDARLEEDQRASGVKDQGTADAKKDEEDASKELTDNKRPIIIDDEQGLKDLEENVESSEEKDILENQILVGAVESTVLLDLVDEDKSEEAEDEPISHETRFTLLQWLNKLAKKGPAVVKELENLYTEYSIHEVKKRNIEELPDITELFKPKREVTEEEIEEKASRSIDFGAIPVSETLAQIYVDQENFEMATEVFKKLMLKYPEKSAFFANRIKELNT